MNILGIICHEDFGHPSACVLQNGKLVSFIEEERLVRVKQAKGYFPSRSIEYCLKEANLTLSDIDIIAFGWDAKKYRFQYPFFLLRSFLHKLIFKKKARLSSDLKKRKDHGSAVVSGIKDILATHPKNIAQTISLGLREMGYLGDVIPPIQYIEHHLCHAATAFYCSGFSESAIFVADGHGEENTISIWKGSGLNIELVKEWNIPHSLGWFYSIFTEFLGWDANEGEVKLMGLAPYGKPDKNIQDIIEDVLILKEDSVILNTNYTFYNRRSFGRFYSDYLVERMGMPRKKDEPITEMHKNIAYAVQKRLEEAGLLLAKLALKLTGSKNLCFAGGVALNCKMNGFIHSQKIADNFFAQPLSYDAGVSIGAAMIAAKNNGEDPRFKMEHLYFGPQYSDYEIEKILQQNLLSYKKTGAVAKETATLISQGKIVAWFQGRMEAGPRALGSRSILGDPRNPKMKDMINDRAKFREGWRPFALSILDEYKNEYLVNASSSPFMTMAYPVQEKVKDTIPSGIHEVDYTTRPQTVEKNVNPLYWEMINEFRMLTNVPAVLNTSFNIKGEPIVCTPEDALKTFFSTGIDVLFIGSFILEKNA